MRGRTSGKQLAVPMDPPFAWQGTRYLVSPLGDTHWARNLRVAREGELRIGHRLERFEVVELHGAERDAIVTEYANTITCGCRMYLKKLLIPRTIRCSASSRRGVLDRAARPVSDR